MFFHSVTEEILAQSHVLDHLKTYLGDDNQAMLEAKAIPEDIIEDLTILYRKWDRGDFSVLARRGLVARGANGQYFPDQNWPHSRRADYFGHGHLVNGQSWGSRLELHRDGAHGPLIAGISGSTKQGARSIVMGLHDEANKEFYADVDQGNTIYYCGTANRREAGDDRPTNLKDAASHRPAHIIDTSGEPTIATRIMMTSCKKGRPVRVFRSARLSHIVPKRPTRGFRYDGLYAAKDYEVLNNDRGIYRFRLERLTEGQGPIRESLPPPMPESRRQRARQD